MTLNRILKTALNFKGATIDKADFRENRLGEIELVVHVHPSRKHRWRCPVCGRKCNVHEIILQSKKATPRTAHHEAVEAQTETDARRARFGAPLQPPTVFESSTFHDATHYRFALNRF